jgi:hypothetical protein
MKTLSVTSIAARLLFLLALIFICTTMPGHAAATLTQDIDPKEGTVGTPLTLTLTVKNATAGNIKLPAVDGLVLNGSGNNPNVDDGKSVAYTFFLTPTHAGDFTIPAFDFKTDDGQTLHVPATKLHVVNGGN